MKRIRTLGWKIQTLHFPQEPNPTPVFSEPFCKWKDPFSLLSTDGEIHLSLQTRI